MGRFTKSAQSMCVDEGRSVYSITHYTLLFIGRPDRCVASSVHYAACSLAVRHAVKDVVAYIRSQKLSKPSNNTVRNYFMKQHRSLFSLCQKSLLLLVT